MNAYKDVKNLSLIVQPGDSFFPLVSAIDSARSSINMTIFRMDDPVVQNAMRRAVARGVKVRALVAPESKGWNKRNRKLGDELANLGIEVCFPSGQALKVKRFHYKLMMVDDSESLILTFNPTKSNLHYARDFGLLIKDQVITSELNRLFSADWHGEDFTPSETALVISPDNSRGKIRTLLQSATRSIRIMDSKLRDKKIVNLLTEKAAAGCRVQVISRRPDSSRTAALAIKPPARYKLHAKCIVIDGAYTFIGSQNLRKVSLDGRREVGIIIEDDAISRKIARIFDDDWNGAGQVQPGI